MEERAGGVLPAKAAERDWPRMDPPNVLWFSGAYTIGFAVYGLLGTLPTSHSSLWVFITSLAFLTAFSAASHYLLRLGWWVPGGLAAALAVSLVPAVSASFLRLIGVSPHDFQSPFTNFNGYTFGVAVATALAAVVAFALTRFTFILGLGIAAILAGSQFLAAWFDSSLTGNDRAATALVTGALLVIVGVFLDAFGRRRDAFWFHVLGWFTVAVGLVFFIVVPSGDPERGWIPMLIVGILMLMVAGPIRRATWAVYGVLGYYAPILHYLNKGINDNSWLMALALLAVGLSIFAWGAIMHRYGQEWGARFVRRPPPALDPPA